jgi:hypothetical protein
LRRFSKAQLSSDQFRSRAAEILTDSDWLDEGVRLWVQKELCRGPGYTYTENEHAALARISAAGTLFDGWDGYSVSELLSAASCYKADGDCEDERLFDEHMAKGASRLRLGDIGHLVGFCRNVAGLSVAPFKPEITEYDEMA